MQRRGSSRQDSSAQPVTQTTGAKVAASVRKCTEYITKHTRWTHLVLKSLQKKQNQNTNRNAGNYKQKVLGGLKYFILVYMCTDYLA